MGDKQMVFLDRYIAAAKQQLATLAGRSLTEKEIEALCALAALRFRDSEVALVNPHLGTRADTTLGKLAVWAPGRGDGDSAAIWTGQGTLYKPHKEHHSILGEMVIYLLSMRGVVKKQMFKLISEGHPKKSPEVRALDQAQKIWKLLANAFYGALSEKGFHFRDEAGGPAITYCGQLIISATLWGFESFLTGNYWLRDADELARHVAACIHVGAGELPTATWGDLNGEPDVAQAADALVAHCAPGWNARPVAEALMATLCPEALWAVVLRGDPFTFASFPRAHNLIEQALAGEVTVEGQLQWTPDAKAALDELAAGMLRWVAPPWLPGDLPHRVAEMRRRAVVLTDTDSTFISLALWRRHLEAEHGVTTPAQRLTGLNCMIHVITALSGYQMELLTRNLGVPEDKRSLIRFKNEFVIDRMALTGGKKHYVALVRYQEGVELPGGGEVEIRGLAIKKTTVARSTGKYFEKSIADHLLRSPVVDRAALIRDVVELEGRVRASLMAGETTYSTPGVLGRLSEYAEQHAMPVVRGMLAWNAAQPDQPIREGDRVNTFRLRVGTDAALLADEAARWPEGSEERTVLTKLVEVFFGPTSHEGLQRNGLNWLAVPKDLAHVPPWAAALIDPENAIQANISPILPILESVGVQLLRQKPETYSSAVAF
jgi:hypothetical protein